MMFLVGMALFGATIVTLGLYICLYVYVYIYIDTVGICIYCMYVCVCVYVYIYIYIRVCVYYVTFMASGLRNNKHTGHAPKSEVILNLEVGL